jgi:protein gp37
MKPSRSQEFLSVRLEVALSNKYLGCSRLAGIRIEIQGLVGSDEKHLSSLKSFSWATVDGILGISKAQDN